MSEENVAVNGVKEEVGVECRACLQILDADSLLYYIFQNWTPPWDGMEDTIAQDMAKLAQVQISDLDNHSNMVCEVCYQKLKDACIFTSLVKQTDQILRQRCSISIDQYCTDQEASTEWPKPIQLDKTVSLATDQMELDIKEEILSENENEDKQEETQEEIPQLDIKIEPEELTKQYHSGEEINGHCDDIATDVPLLNGDSHLNAIVKDEPQSEEDQSVTTDLSLECMLCAKHFNSVSGLKAHVIAQHSYKSVRRKSAHEISPLNMKRYKYVCGTCRRRFSTSTDLMVHETCHNKTVCYGCNNKFDTFDLLLRHRHLCKGLDNKEQTRVKTLEDVQRPVRVSRPPAPDKGGTRALTCLLCGDRFNDMYCLNVHQEITHPTPVGAVEEMEVEALESLFSERA